MTLVIANLDCEVEWGAQPLPAHVRVAVAALGTLCRVLGDVVETIAPVDPARVPGGATLMARGAHALAPDDVIAWGATAAWAASGSVAIARRACDRRLAAAVEDELAARAPGSAVVDDDRGLDDAIAAAAAASPAQRWVAKAAICAAGRDRVLRRGAALDDATRTRLHRLRARAGALVVEPWLDRVLDLGQCAELDARGALRLWPAHRLLCDERGGFQGIAIGDDAATAPHADELARAAGAAGRALAALGYRGPFTIDGFVHRTARGLALRPLCEINPRLSFGRLAHVLADRLGPGTLALGRGAPPGGATPLLLPADDEPTSAWWLTSSSTSSRSPAR